MITTLLSLVALDSLLNPGQTNAAISQDTFYISANAYPQEKPTAIAPVIEAKAVLSIDLETGKVLYSQSPSQQLPMASLTKLMTALIILEESSPDDIVTVNKIATQIEPSKMNLVTGEKITIKDLLKGIFIKSANDAAVALALHSSPSVEEFAAKMNGKAKALGLNSTHFVNPDGLDADTHYSTAEDLAVLARAVYKYELIQKIVILKEADVSSVDGRFTHELKTTNDLLGSYLNVLGLKTGTTDEAGQCLITIVENENGNKILNVMLGSPARFQETKILSQWLFDNFNWI